MTRRIQHLLLLIALVMGPPGTLRGEEEDPLAVFRTALDEKMDAQLEADAEKGRKLREGYLGALERLKGTLGREEKLKAAAQVLAEIESIEAGEEPGKVPAGADRRFTALRDKWVKGQEEIHAQRNKELEKLITAYLKALEDKKRKLTRAGKIKEALAFEEEAKRVSALPEVKAALNPVEEPAVQKGDGNLALASKGAKVRGAKRGGSYMIDGKTADPEKFAWDQNPCNLEVHLSKVYLIDRIRFLLFTGEGHSYKYKLMVSRDGKDWTVIADRSRQFQKQWQEIEFEAQELRYIRVNGLKNTGNRNFHIVELEAYSPNE